MYGHNLLSFTSSVYRHHRIEALHLPNNGEERINLMTEESDRQLLHRRHKYIHLGLVVFGIRGLIRKQIGGKVLIVLYDSKFSEKEKAIIRLLEVYMNHNLGITYLWPNFNMTIKDFVKHIKIVIQARGYENFQNHNTQLDVIFLGKTMNYISNDFKIQIDGIIENLSSKGITFLKTREYNLEDLAPRIIHKTRRT